MKIASSQKEANTDHLIIWNRHAGQCMYQVRDDLPQLYQWHEVGAVISNSDLTERGFVFSNGLNEHRCYDLGHGFGSREQHS